VERRPDERVDAEERSWPATLGLLLTRPLRRMWRSDDPLDAYALVHLASVAADTFLVIALADSIFFSLPVGEARLRVALYLAVTMAPLAVAGPLLVPLLDRSPYRRTISFAASALRAVAVVFAAAWISSALLFPAVFTVLVLTKIHLIAKNGLTVAYAPGGPELMRSNAFLARTAVAGFALAAGPAIGLLQLGGARATLYAAAAVYSTAALLNLRLAPAEVPPPEPGELGARGRVPALAPAALGAGGLRGAQGYLMALLTFALRAAGAPAAWFGVLVAAGTLGAATGDFVVPRLPKRVREEVVLVGSLLTAAVAAFLAFQAYGLPMLALFAGLAGMSTESGRLAFQSLMQTNAPGGAQGRVFVRYEVVFQLAWVTGAFIPAMFPLPFRGGILALAVYYALLAVLYLVRVRALGRPDEARPPLPG
jgi:hypothetical protein